MPLAHHFPAFVDEKLIEATQRDVARVEYCDYDLVYCLRRLLEKSPITSEADREDLLHRVFTPHDRHRFSTPGDEEVENRRRYQDLARLLTVSVATFDLIKALPVAASWSPHFRLDIFPVPFFDAASKLVCLCRQLGYPV